MNGTRTKQRPVKNRKHRYRISTICYRVHIKDRYQRDWTQTAKKAFLFSKLSVHQQIEIPYARTYLGRWGLLLILFCLECGLVFDWDSSLSLLAKEVLVATVPCAKSFLREKRNVSNETEGEGRRERERGRKVYCFNKSGLPIIVRLWSRIGRNWWLARLDVSVDENVRTFRNVANYLWMNSCLSVIV